ncbi:hypothetical protein [Halobacteriovorax sp. DA5]|uniref:hypothetical protein n=1 Tax=Halobacteriovorax sp. DA5 TaxID=2067553 RepID=UPI000CD186AB|nr:hypothetical protein [Halobacteriovorax sp. DA5]POB14291.1 hypothetical protein C0Z22_04165 [Halobacteriovorax sp. DA5]
MSVLFLTSCVSHVDFNFDDDKPAPSSGDGVGKVITTSDFSFLMINDTGSGNEVYLSYGLAADTVQVPNASFAYSKMTNPDTQATDSVGNHYTFSNGMIVAGFNSPNYDIILIDKSNNFNVLATIPGFGDTQSDPIFVNRVGNQLFFIIKSTATTYDLWVTDTTVAGTKMLKTVSNTYYSTLNIRERNVLFNNKMYFKGGDAVNGPELWVTDGTVSGTKMVDDYIAGASGLDPRRFSVANNNLYIFSQTNQTIYQMGADEVISEVTSLPASMTSATFNEAQVVSNDSYFCFKLSVSSTKYLTCINTDTQVAESRLYTRSADFLGEDGGKIYFADVVDIDPTAATDYTAYIYETSGAISSQAPSQIHEMSVPVEILRTSQINYDNSNGAISYLKYDHTDDGDKHMFVKIKDSVVTEIDNIIYPFSTDPNITQINLYTSYSAYRSTTPGTFVYLVNDAAMMLTVLQSDGTLAGTQVLTQVDLADIMADISGGNAAQGYARYIVGLLDGMSVVRPYDFSVDQYFNPNASGLK